MEDGEIILIVVVRKSLLISLLKKDFGASLVVQWLRICLPMQGTWVWSLVWEDPTCRGATKPVCHNYWACSLEPTSHNYWAHVPQLLKPMCLEPLLRNKRSHRMRSPHTATKSSPLSLQLEKAHAQQRRPNATKKKKKKISIYILSCFYASKFSVTLFLPHF